MNHFDRQCSSGRPEILATVPIMEKTVQNSSPCFHSNHLDSTCALINAYTSRCFNGIHTGAKVAAQVLEKYQKPSPDQMRLAAMLEQNMQWSKYNAEALLFPKLAEMQNFCYGKQNLIKLLRKILSRKLSN